MKESIEMDFTLPSSELVKRSILQGVAANDITKQ
jgi:hypothetical protein